MSVFEELNRRGVVRAAAMYVAIAFGGTEILVFLIEALQGEQAAGPARRYLAILFIAGFPVAMYLSWTRDIGLQARRILAAGTLAILLVAALIWIIPEPPGPSRESSLQALSADPKSIAVLPFVNMSGDEENTYFSHGISEELLNVLTRIPGLKVSSRTSSFHFAGRSVPVREIAARLAVRHILEGSVRKNGNNVRITAQLIDAETDAHLWSETYDREVLDTFAVQDDIATEIVDKLQLTLDGGIQTRRPTDNEQAYDRFLRGLHLLREGWSAGDFSTARDYFIEAIELDPNYAQAHALLATTYVSQGNFRHVAPKEVFPLGYQSATTALSIDNTLPDAHVAMGWLTLTYEYDWRRAEKAFRRAVEIAPSSYMGYIGLSFALQTGNRLDEALTVSRRAHELDPLTFWTRNSLVEVYYKRRDYDAAMEQSLAMLELQPDDPLMVAGIGLGYAQMGMSDEARQYADRATQLAAGDANLALYPATVYAMIGDEEQARGHLEQALAQRDSTFVSPGSIAVIYTHLGEHDTAIDWLYRAVDEYDSYAFNLGYPDFDALRSEPRFIELCEELRMPCATEPGIE